MIIKEKDARLSQFLRKLLQERKVVYDLVVVEEAQGIHQWAKLGKTISALANSAVLAKQSCANIILGVDTNTFKVTGTSFDLATTIYKNQHLPDSLGQKIYPSLHLNFKSFTYYEEDGTNTGKTIVIIEVPAATYMPISYDHIRYIIKDDNIQTLEYLPELERQLWAIFNKKNFLFQRATSNLTTTKLKTLLNLKAYPKLQSLKDQITENELLDLLEKDRFIERDLDTFAITNLGALLLASDVTAFEGLRHCTITVAVYNDISKTVVNRQMSFKTGYAVGLSQVLETLTELMPHWEDIDTDGVRRLRPKAVPGIVLHEVLVNCMIHQDLTKPNPILIELFKDRIEFTNSSTPAIDVARFIDSISECDNKPLAKFLMRCGMCEPQGLGLDKALGALEATHATSMRFDALPNATRVVIPYLKTFKNMTHDEKLRSCVIHCALRFVNSQGMTNTSLRERFGLSKDAVLPISQLIRRALKKELIKQVPATSKRNSQYVPIWADCSKICLK